ncbi:exported protein of unknown function [Candidatus Hydrogenisulfobacillus filiaventi]|uniref:Uncharacterized protein n=1 Tax=Candidatus Hydrogenisulfobacillus filiaventi TaxID=2707344 RepID=A0A6F8ZHL2_9FIRM|nr:exported protein of unknown function [Candidatus Hydrogenisulfobacillus filiaventi]
MTRKRWHRAAGLIGAALVLAWWPGPAALASGGRGGGGHGKNPAPQPIEPRLGCPPGEVRVNIDQPCQPAPAPPINYHCSQKVRTEDGPCFNGEQAVFRVVEVPVLGGGCSTAWGLTGYQICGTSPPGTGPAPGSSGGVPTRTVTTTQWGAWSAWTAAACMIPSAPWAPRHGQGLNPDSLVIPVGTLPDGTPIRPPLTFASAPDRAATEQVTQAAEAEGTWSPGQLLNAPGWAVYARSRTGTQTTETVNAQTGAVLSSTSTPLRQEEAVEVYAPATCPVAVGVPTD